MIEVLVALALIAMSVSAIASVIFASTKGVRSLEDHLSVMEIARLISTSLPKREDLVPGRLFGEALGQRWRVDIAPYGGDNFAPIANSPWIPEIVVIQVQSPLGANVSLETVRLQRRRTE